MQYKVIHPQPYSGNYNGLKFDKGVAVLDSPLPERSMGDTIEEIAVFLKEHGFAVEAVSEFSLPSVESTEEPKG